MVSSPPLARGECTAAIFTGDASTSDEARATTDALATDLSDETPSSRLAPTPLVVSMPKSGADARGGGDCNDGDKDASQGDGGDGASLTSTVVGVAGSDLSCCFSVPRLIGDDANAACHTGSCMIGTIGIAWYMRALWNGWRRISKSKATTLMLPV